MSGYSRVCPGARLRDRIQRSRDRGLPFFHRLKHRALGFGARAVDLIEQHDVGVHWT